VRLRRILIHLFVYVNLDPFLDVSLSLSLSHTHMFTHTHKHHIQVRRSDVLSAWRGFRPLATDPHAPPGAPVSREHVVSRNPKTGVFFVVGGKWTTYRSVAEDAINRVLEMTNIPTSSPSRTLTMPLIGAEGYTNTLSLKLAQRFGISESCAQHLARTYVSLCYILEQHIHTSHAYTDTVQTQLMCVTSYLEPHHPLIIWIC